MRSRQLLALLAIVLFTGSTLYLLHRPGKQEQAPSEPPTPVTTHGSHPISKLVAQAEREQAAQVARQSKSLRDAVAEYERRYQLHPPPNFDKWYDFARAKGVQLIDEYDTIHQSLLPFWAVKPSVIRERAREALGFDNAMVGVLVRDGRVVNIDGGDQEGWQRNATKKMIGTFVQHLPDMDLAFNRHDEARVILAHDDLSRLIHKATSETIPAAFAQTAIKNAWSARPKDVDDGRQFPEVRITRFNRFAHQSTWSHSRVSCPAESPARSLDEQALDDEAAYALEPLGFIYNHSAFSDICLSPSLRKTFGFFERPNAFDIVQDLFPIFSQSKPSSFQDILYPSPWYWSEKAPYLPSEDHDWGIKHGKMYWRGSTTGGFSRDGGWRRQHRQRIVQKINAPDSAQILEEQTSDDGTAAGWQVKDVPRPDLQDLFDVRFSHVGQCDPGDCDAQKEFFDVVPAAPRQDAYRYKYIIDMDGNAFSGRFYAFLKSKSLIFKMAIFREWHEEWLRPWAHYVPLSLRADEYAEAVRYFDREEAGQTLARRVADGGREWGNKVLRREDYEAWFFRLLLEYGRLVDDGRENIGFRA